MTVRFASEKEITNWNKKIIANPDGGNIFQSIELAEQKKLGGWIPRFIVAGDIAITALEKTVPLLGKMWYLPKGPGITTVREFDDLLPELKKFVRKSGVFAIKTEPEIPKTQETLADLMKLGLVRVPAIQPNVSTVLVDISAPLTDVLGHLNQKGRHAIKRAERDGVSVKRVPATEENCQLMYALLSETAAGAFTIRPYNYYKAFWQRFEKAGLGQLFLAYFEGQVVASAYGMVLGEKSTYKDGASVRQRPTYGASHLLQWSIIQWAKENGARVHDLCGTPPSTEIKNPDHPHYGLGRFKTSFNKEVTDYVGAYDIVVKPMAYSLWVKIGQRIVHRLYTYRHRENWY